MDEAGVEQRQAMTGAGVNVEPGSADDGWVSPPSVELGDGTVIQLHKDGEALQAAYNAIRGARRRICLEVYIFRSDATGRAFGDLLMHKARHGVAVYVIYDSWGSVDSDGAMFEQMAKAGVRVAAFHPVKPWECRYSWRLVNRDHRKLLLVDEDMAGLGGLNVGGEYAGSWVVRRRLTEVPYRDNAVGLRGPSALMLGACFARTWRYVQRGGLVGQTGLFHNAEAGEFGVLASAPTRRSPLVGLRRMMREAKLSILLTVAYFAPPDELVEELCRAGRRGVRVRLMLPGVCDVRLLMTAARSFYERLMMAGVEVYERQHAVLHAKTMCIDGTTTILGSTNLDYRSIEFNCELSVVIRSKQFGAQIHDLFDHDVGFARRINLAEWRRRPTWDRVVQWAVLRARYLL